LEERGLVRRERAPVDGRVVLVSLTAAGTTELEETRGELKVALRRYVAGMSDEQLQALADSTETLGELIETIQQGVGR
jgi:DNA-binding MarR family transcriptional regulator